MKKLHLCASSLYPLLALPLLVSPSLATQCPEISTEFASSGASAAVHAQSVVQLGGFDQLLVGGDFLSMGEVEANYLALWDGVAWSSFAPGVPGPVLAIAQYDDGNGPMIYAGGFTFLASWDGASWTSQYVAGTVLALHVHDDGQGSALFAAGAFESIGGTALSRLGRYSGSWEAMDGGLSFGEAYSLASHDDGSGSALYIGGFFPQAGNTVASGLVSWDGSTYSTVGQALIGGGGLAPQVNALQSYTPPGGVAELHVGGRFSGVSGMSTSRWIAWRQNIWVDIGGGQVVERFTLRNEPAGSTIYAGRSGGVDRYDGITRSMLPFSLPSEVTSIRAFGPGTAQDLFVSTSSFNESGSYFARRNGGAWEPLFSGPGVGQGLPGTVLDLEVHDFGQGEMLTAFGSSPWAQGSSTLQYDGSTWSSISITNASSVNIVKAVSSGGELYAVGGHYFPDQDETYGVAHLNGNTWEPMGNPIFPASQTWTTPNTMTVVDFGTGPEVFFGFGSFGDIGASGTRGIARLEGNTWASVGGGVTLGPSGSTGVRRAIAWDHGTGPALYVGGRFQKAGGVPARYIARWDGNQWSALGNGLVNVDADWPQVNDMVIFNSPSGAQLVVTGDFTLAGGITVNSIAAWDGTGWNRLGQGLLGEAAVGVKLLAHDPDGQGEKLYVSGSFSSAGGVPADRAAVWDGTSWSESAMLPAPYWRSMLSYDDGSGRSLYVAGPFSTIGGVGSVGIGKMSDSCGAILGTPSCTSNPNSTGLMGTTRASGSASFAAADITLHARNLPPNVFSLFFAGTGLQYGIAGDGVLCVAGGLNRLSPGALSSATGETTKVFDFSAGYAANVTPGQSLVIQGFYRDPAGGPAGFNTTDAIDILILP